MKDALYDGLADEYATFQDVHAQYYALAGDVLKQQLGTGSGRVLDLGCGTGRYLPTLVELGYTHVVGVDVSADQLRLAHAACPEAELVRADAGSVPFGDESFDAVISMFTHTDVDDFASALREARRVLRVGGRLVYVGNHPCFVGATQEHTPSGIPVLHPGYRRRGRSGAASSPGITPGGWRERLGSAVHLPLGDFLEAFAGFTLVAACELEDGWEYPKTFALAWVKAS